MRYYRTLTRVNDTPEGEIIELSDGHAEPLLRSGAIEAASADHLVKRYGASGKVDAGLEKAMRQMRDTAIRVKDEIAALDVKLAELTADRANVLSGNLHKEDALALIREDIRRKGDGFKDRMVREVLNGRQGPYIWDISTARHLDKHGHIGVPFLGEPRAGGSCSQEALYFYFPDLIEAGFLKMIDGFKWDENAVRLDERRGRVKAIEKEIAELQGQRNVLAEQLAGIASE